MDLAPVQERAVIFQSLLEDLLARVATVTPAALGTGLPQNVLEGLIWMMKLLFEKGAVLPRRFFARAASSSAGEAPSAQFSPFETLTMALQLLYARE